MTKARWMSRLERAEQVLRPLGVTRHAVTEAFEQFRATGVLPDDPLLAEHAAHYARTGCFMAGLATPEEVAARLAYILGQARRAKRGEPTDKPNRVRNRLFAEAVRGTADERDVARPVLIALVQAGADVADPQFLADCELPAFGTVAMMLAGFPDRLAVPPYEAQAQRLFTRYAELLQRVPAGGWGEQVAGAARAFRDRGEVPRDELLLAGVLALPEFGALAEHRQDHDVGDLMAALDAAATCRRADRDEAVAHVRAIVMQRRDQPDGVAPPLA